MSGVTLCSIMETTFITSIKYCHPFAVKIGQLKKTQKQKHGEPCTAGVNRIVSFVTGTNSS